MVRWLLPLLLTAAPAVGQSATLRAMTGAELLSYSDGMQTMYIKGYLDRSLAGGPFFTAKQTDHYVDCIVNAGFTNGTLREATIASLRSDPSLLTLPASSAIWSMLIRACGVAIP